MEKYTPMMEAYLKTKEDYKDAILFYRLGDFYEMFFDDAITASRELELVLTGKNCGVKERAPMCGVPFHAADAYVSRLVEKGYKVAICEQVEDPKLAKGIVKREVVRVVTPATNIDSENDQASYLACIIKVEKEYGLSLSDVCTGDFIIRQNLDFERLRELLIKAEPKEIILNDVALIEKDILESGFVHPPSFFVIKNVLDDIEEAKAVLLEHFIENYSEYQSENYSLSLISAANLLKYLFTTQKNSLSHINHIDFVDEGELLKIDAFTFRNLELIEPLRRDDNKGSLFFCLDKTNTAMGRRLLKTFIRYPLTNPKEIEDRLDAVEEFTKDLVLAEELREILKPIYDLERIISRVSYKSANPRDLLALRDSIRNLPAIISLLSDLKANALIDISKMIDPLTDIFKLIDDSINEDAPIGVHDSDIIKLGYSNDCDRLRAAATDGKSLLANLEEKERERTGIKKLRIKYNRVFGYYIEVTNSALSMVPDDYIRRQTLANCERFFTEELKSLEDTILGAKEKLDRLEFELYSQILDQIFENIPRIQQTAVEIAKLDVYLSFASVAVKNHYTRPIIDNSGSIDIIGGRHPVVETMLKNESFIDNDTHLNNDDKMVYLITGPNMAGKSTYMRQCALIVLMAQMGCFVPAKESRIGVVDRIFTRVGASDDLVSGQSTFMVEMNEMANILKNATSNSLIILDEIGRGTSTYDGLSIAWAVIEHISDKSKLGAKTLFATHYHELTALEDSLDGVINFSSAVKEDGDHISFLRKIIKGAADRSYGIQVAALAGVPQEVTNRAKEILLDITSENKDYVNVNVKERKETDESSEKQLSFFDYNPKQSKIIDEIKAFDLNNATPMDAMNFINSLKGKVQ